MKEKEAVKIQLWKNRNELSDKYVIIDKEDYDKVIEAIRYKSGKPGKWYYHGSIDGYEYAVGGNRDKSIHRVVMDAPEGMDVDHINGDRLNNTKSNLRVCTRSQNSQNKKLRTDSASGYKGVYKHKGNLKKPFQAYIGDPNKVSRSLKLGYYATAEEAARVYDRKALELHGEFAYTNFPKEDYDR